MFKAKVILCVGTRPNYVKLKPIADLLPDAIIVDSGQHYDYQLSRAFFRDN